MYPSNYHASKFFNICMISLRFLRWLFSVLVHFDSLINMQCSQCAPLLLLILICSSALPSASPRTMFHHCPQGGNHMQKTEQQHSANWLVQISALGIDHGSASKQGLIGVKLKNFCHERRAKMKVLREVPSGPNPIGQQLPAPLHQKQNQKVQGRPGPHP